MKDVIKFLLIIVTAVRMPTLSQTALVIPAMYVTLFSLHLKTWKTILDFAMVYIRPFNLTRIPGDRIIQVDGNNTIDNDDCEMDGLTEREIYDRDPALLHAAYTVEDATNDTPAQAQSILPQDGSIQAQPNKQYNYKPEDCSKIPVALRWILGTRATKLSMVPITLLVSH